MSMRWDLPKVLEREYRKPPSPWWCVMIFVVVQVLAALILLLTQGAGKLEFSAEFFVRLLLFPLFVSGSLCALLYASHEAMQAEVDWWNFLCRYLHAQWRSWTQQQLAVMECVVLTGEENLVERLLDPASTMSLNTGQRLSLGETEGLAGQPRLGLVVQRLVRPCLAHLPKLEGGEVRVFVQTQNRRDVNEVRAALGQLGIVGLDRWKISAVDPTQTATMLMQWMDGHPMPDICLLLACQLHDSGTETNSEAAVAMMFASRSLLARHRGQIKSKAGLLRPISVSQGQAFEALNTLLEAESAPRSRIKHLWMSCLPPMERLALLAAVKDTGLELLPHDVDQAIGPAGQASPLVLQALGAQLAAHGQGVQLVAVPSQDGIRLNLVSTQADHVEHVDARLYARTVFYAPALAVSCLAALGVGYSILTPAWPPWIGWLFVGAAMLAFPLVMWNTAYQRRSVEREFYKALYR